MAARSFLVGDFANGAAVGPPAGDDPGTEQHDDLFVKNTVAILAEERLALTVYRPQLFVKGNFVE